MYISMKLRGSGIYACWNPLTLLVALLLLIVANKLQFRLQF